MQPYGFIDLLMNLPPALYVVGSEPAPPALRLQIGIQAVGKGNPVRSWNSIHVLLGPVSESRAAIYALHSQQTSVSMLPPMGGPDAPANGDVASGTVLVDGWSWALPGMASVDVFLDGNHVGTATYGVARPDIPVAFPGAPSDVGFQYSLDTTRFSNGSHALVVKATDKNGHVATFATQQITISN